MATRNLADAQPALVGPFLAAKEQYEAAHPGHEIVPICVYRSPEEQWETFKHGRHQNADGGWVPDDPVHHTGILTNCDGRTVLSNHNRKPSRAIDFMLMVNGHADWNVAHGYIEFGHLCVEHGLAYGGDWVSFKDSDHVELRVSEMA